MKKFTKQALAIVAIATFAAVGCKKGADGNFSRSNGAGGPFDGADSVITGNITASRTLSPGKTYKLNGVVYVTGGAKLTIKPGTVLTRGEAVAYKVDPSSPATNSIAGVLVITKNATIDAVGTSDQPIVFTTPNAVGSRHAGDFGGIVILGEATTNKAVTQEIEGLPKFDAAGNSLGVDISYGGSAPADNSGRFRYVRIEYAGYKLAENNEVNGLTLGGVGSGTTLDHVQVSWGADDGFEFFGGTVNASYLLAIANDDDDFDTDFGYSGRIQYAIGLKDPTSTHSISNNISDSNGIESDNDAAGSSATPRTLPTYLNFTLLGYASAQEASELRSGNRWRRNTSLSISNSIIAGYNTGAEFESAGTISSATGFTNNRLHAYLTPASTTLPASNQPFSTAANPDTFVGLGTGGLSPFYTTDAAASGYSFDNLLARTDNTKGAVIASNYANWASGWAQFNPQESQD
jgi:hypothetical protein